MKKRLKTLDKIFITIVFIFIVVSVLIGYFNTIYVQNFISEMAAEQLGNSSKVLALAVQREIDEGNYRNAWKQIYRGLTNSFYVSFVLEGADKKPLVYDIGSINSFYKYYKKNDWRVLSSDDNLQILLSRKNDLCLIIYSYNENSLIDTNHIISMQIIYKVGTKLRKTVSIIYFFGGAFLLVLVVGIILFIIIRKYFLRSLIVINDGIQNILENREVTDQIDIILDEYFPTKSIIYNLKESYIKVTKKLKKQAEIESIGILARQVSHDIRSPLAALSMAIKDIDNLPEDKRYILRNATQRIQDIANNLLAKKKSENIEKVELKSEMISTSIDEIISEKRLHYRAKLDVNISSNLDQAYGLFSKINPVEFKRVLSNLINNSVEAFEDSKGEVEIWAAIENDKIKIIIKDNGRGIPKEIINKIFDINFSHGKEKNAQSGSGIGLHHAKTTIESWGGNLNIDSTENQGTEINITLNKSEAPKWFLEELTIQKNAIILILDDDQGIHQTWEQKLSQINNQRIHFSTPAEVRQWITDNNKQNILCLFDYEIIKDPTTGLDLIEELNLGPQAILVTSYYDEKNIRDRIEKIGAKILPKADVGIVSIEIAIAPKINFYDAIYIEDDELLRMGWQMYAEKKNINLLTLTSTRDFKKHTKQISKEHTKIYLDRDLGEGEIMGDQFAKELHQAGYKNLFLVTGSEKDDLEDLPFLTIADKACPWE